MRWTYSSGVLIYILGQVLLSGCGMETASAAPTSGGSATSAPRTDQSMPTSNQSPTPTATNTWVPTHTPTEGPPPDLELVNASLYPKYDYFYAYQEYTLLGRVRNNTDKIMIFNYDYSPFRFTFERWEYDSRAGQYFHEIYEDTPKMGYDPDERRLMNCFLYPGDEGVIVLKTPGLYSKEIVSGYFDAHDGPLGVWYTYESYYQEQPDLRLDWHPKAENLVYTKKDGNIDFDYDIYVPESKQGVYSTLKSWTMLLDADGRILNVLYKNLENLGGMGSGVMYHVHGTTATPITDHVHYFFPAIKITPAMIEQVDHIEIFAEQEDGLTCRR